MSPTVESAQQSARPYTSTAKKSPPRKQHKIRKPRPPTRKIVRWTVDLDTKLLLSIHSACSAAGIKLPWQNIAHLVGGSVTEGAIVQHLAKLRLRSAAKGMQVPPPLKRGGARVKGQGQMPTTANTPPAYLMNPPGSAYDEGDDEDEDVDVEGDEFGDYYYVDEDDGQGEDNEDDAANGGGCCQHSAAMKNGASAQSATHIDDTSSTGLPSLPVSPLRRQNHAKKCCQTRYNNNDNKQEQHGSHCHRRRQHQQQQQQQSCNQLQFDPMAANATKLGASSLPSSYENNLLPDQALNSCKFEPPVSYFPGNHDFSFLENYPATSAAAAAAAAAAINACSPTGTNTFFPTPTTTGWSSPGTGNPALDAAVVSSKLNATLPAPPPPPPIDPAMSKTATATAFPASLGASTGTAGSGTASPADLQMHDSMPTSSSSSLPSSLPFHAAGDFRGFNKDMVPGAFDFDLFDNVDDGAAGGAAAAAAFDMGALYTNNSDYIYNNNNNDNNEEENGDSDGTHTGQQQEQNQDEYHNDQEKANGIYNSTTTANTAAITPARTTTATPAQQISTSTEKNLSVTKSEIPTPPVSPRALRSTELAATSQGGLDVLHQGDNNNNNDKLLTSQPDNQQAQDGHDDYFSAFPDLTTALQAGIDIDFDFDCNERDDFFSPSNIFAYNATAAAMSVGAAQQDQQQQQ